MNEEEKQYLPYLRLALEAKEYPADAQVLIVESDFAVHIIADAWKLHVPYETAQQWFENRWLIGPLRAYWLWRPGTELAKLPQDVSVRAEETIKRRKKQEPETSQFVGTLDSGYARGSGYRPPSR